MSNLSVLIIDDEKNLIRSIIFSLSDPSIEVAAAHTGKDGIEQFQKSRPDVVLLDLGLPDMSGLDVLHQLKTLNADTPVIMISAHGDTRTAVQAVKDGAVDYLTKPFDIDELEVLIHRCAEQQRTQKELSFLRAKQGETQSIVGLDATTTQLKAFIEQIGNSSAKTVLITGESGTGKSLIARCVHDTRFKDAPFIEINCAALPEQLIEAELFGAERGAYTGASQKRDGLIALADTGTLFLDEIGEMPLSAQTKLLSFLENRSYRPIGGNRIKQANVVVIAATNRDLKQAVTDGAFREDLFYRLNVLPIHAPALRERPKDIPLLIKYFTEQFSNKEGSKAPLWDPALIQLLQTYAWPGNIRELKNLVERFTILYPGITATAQHLPPEYAPQQAIQTPESNTPELTSQVESKEREIILKALSDSNGRKSVAAEKLGISRHALKRRLQRLNIES
ncbi:sigma-54-dependent transcriptional regulator [Neptunomonas phycophila]|uniref:sigma-54-dependent transcriptional regulator n=1 Tax=Neptunomonas phycophila TaxID=1572645 RepID=UPI0037369AC1